MKPKVLDIATNQVSRFVTLQRDANRLEVEDAFFNTASALFLPDVPGANPAAESVLLPFTNVKLLAAMRAAHQEFTTDLVTVPFDPDTPDAEPERETGLHVIIAALRFLEKNPTRQLVIAGHTDRAGDDAFNFRLSAARGKSVLAVLEGKRADFIAACSVFHVPEDDPIVLRFAARTQGFKTVPANASRVSSAEMKEFQREFNQQFQASIPVTGVSDNATHGAYFDLYEADLEVTAGSKEALQKLRAGVRFVDAAHKVVGFGEKFPRENPGQDGLRSQLNRRVEFLFFAPPRLPNLAAPDVGEQIFKRKLFTFSVLDRDELANAQAITAKAGSTKPLSIETAELVPDLALETSMVAAGIFDVNDAYLFLEPFTRLHPDEGVVPERIRFGDVFSEKPEPNKPPPRPPVPPTPPIPPTPPAPPTPPTPPAPSTPPTPPAPSTPPTPPRENPPRGPDNPPPVDPKPGEPPRVDPPSINPPYKS